MRKKIYCMLLTSILLMTICVTAYASSFTVSPGVTEYGKTYSGLQEAPSFHVTLKGTEKDQITIYLDLYDENKSMWIKSNSAKVYIGKMTTTRNIGPGSAMKFVKNRTTKVRLRFAAHKKNNGNITVSYLKTK